MPTLEWFGKDKVINLNYILKSPTSNNLLFEMGKTTLKTPAGNKVPAYDLEHTICDVLRSRNRLEAETTLAVLKLYAANPRKDLSKLNSYAKKDAGSQHSASISRSGSMNNVTSLK